MVDLHVEATSRCTLACPRCERTTFIDKFGKNNFAIHDLDINDFLHFIDIPVKHINFCGNLGDPIYHKNFLKLISVVKSKCKTVSITTNGSRKSKDWWIELTDLLDSTDHINFSIDGNSQNFTEYRINGDWKSVKTAIKICTDSSVKTIWKYIPFSYNQKNIDETMKFAKKLGINKFKLDLSDRWIDNDPLRPQEHLIGSKDEPKQQFKIDRKTLEIDPKCKNNRTHYIGADGTYTPCCDVKHYEFWYKSEWYKNKMTIKDSKLSECIRRFDNFYATIQDSKPDYCLFNCGKC